MLHERGVRVLVHLRRSGGRENAKYTLSLVDGDGRAAASWLWRRRSATVTYGWPHPRSWGFKVFYLKPLLRFSGYLDDDRLKIRCELTVFTPPRTEDITPAPAPPPELPGHLRLSSD